MEHRIDWGLKKGERPVDYKQRAAPDILYLYVEGAVSMLHGRVWGSLLIISSFLFWLEAFLTFLWPHLGFILTNAWLDLRFFSSLI